jgi:hypothetical protein
MGWVMIPLGNLAIAINLTLMIILMKQKSVKRSLFILVAIIFIVFVSCEKESGYGNYIIGISNSTPTTYNLEVFLDGTSKGTFFAMASQTGNYTDLCGDLVYAANLDNVYILTYVPSGTHTLELKHVSSGNVASTVDFTMAVDGCISQQFNF